MGKVREAHAPRPPTRTGQFSARPTHFLHVTQPMHLSHQALLPFSKTGSHTRLQAPRCSEETQECLHFRGKARLRGHGPNCERGTQCTMKMTAASGSLGRADLLARLNNCARPHRRLARRSSVSVTSHFCAAGFHKMLCYTAGQSCGPGDSRASRGVQHQVTCAGPQMASKLLRRKYFSGCCNLMT